MARKKTSTGKQSLDQAIEELNTQFGEGTVFKLEDGAAIDAEKVPSGIWGLDFKLCGGFGRGSIAELYGPPGGGKSSLAMHLIAEAQKKDEVCVFIDVEHGMNKTLAEKCNVNLTNLVFSQPAAGEDVFEMVEKFIRTGAVSVIVVDSVAAMTPKAELAGDYGDSHVGLQGRMMSQGLRKLTGVMNEIKSQTIVVFINQIREKIGGMGFGGPSTGPSGGRALGFYASVRLEVIRATQIKDGTETVGHQVIVKIPKNRFGVPFQLATYNIYYETGASNSSSVLPLAEAYGVLSKGGGGWYTDTTTGEKVGHGAGAVEEKLDTDKEFFDHVTEQILKRDQDELV